MMDPGTAMAVTSLALTACQGLYDYCTSWAQYGDDTEATRSAILSLRSTFDLVSEALEGAGSSLSQNQLQLLVDRIVDCKAGVEKLSGALNKVRDAEDPKNFQQVVKRMRQRMTYPFRKGILTQAQSAASDLSQRLVLVLEVLGFSSDTKVVAGVEGLKLQITNLQESSEAALQALQLTSNEIRDGVSSLLSAEDRRILWAILSWLDPPDPYVNHADAQRRHERGTGEWFLRSSEFDAWTLGHMPCLWLYGLAGCCKTILSSAIIEAVKPRVTLDVDIGFACFYFSFSDSRKQGYRDLLLSLVCQLSMNRAVHPKLQKAHDARAAPSNATLEEVLSLLIESTKHTYVVVDAVDESPEGLHRRQEVLSGLKRLVAQLDNISLLATSRPEPDIRSAARDWSTTVTVDEDSVNADIRLWVERKLQSNSSLKSLSSASKGRIVTIISEKAGGMFRWAYCQLDELSRLKVMTPRNINAKLAGLPKDLDETYDRMLLAIDEIDRPMALTALTWLTFSKRPMKLKEMQDACIIELDPEVTVNEENRAGRGAVVHLLSALVTVPPHSSRRSRRDKRTPARKIEENAEADTGEDTEEDAEGDAEEDTEEDEMEDAEMDEWDKAKDDYTWNDDEVRLAHFSVAEYLTSERLRNSKSTAAYFALTTEEGHRKIVASCFAYLRHYSDTVTDDERPDIRDKRARLKTLYDIHSRLPLLDYTSWALIHHCEQLESLAANTAPVVEFLRQLDLVKKWASLGPDHERHTIVDRSGRDMASPLYIAARYGLRGSLIALAKLEDDFNSIKGPQGTALHAASSSGHFGCAEWLVNNGAQVDARNQDGNTPLVLAVEAGHEDVVILLLSCGANVHALACDLWGKGNVVLLAFKQRHWQIAQLLVARGADIHVTSDKWGSCLQAAASSGHDEFVNMLVAQGLDVNAKRVPSEAPPLQLAAESCRLETVELLIARGARVNVDDGSKETALHDAASREDGVGIVQALLSAGADVDVEDGDGMTPLEHALRYGSVESVRILLRHGANVNHRTTRHGTPLYESSALLEFQRARVEEIQAVLVANGATSACPIDVTPPIEKRRRSMGDAESPVHALEVEKPGRVRASTVCFGSIQSRVTEDDGIEYVFPGKGLRRREWPFC